MQKQHSRNPEAHGKPVELFMLGPMDIRVGGSQVDLPARKARALVAYLARRQDVDVPREVLCGLLWGGRSDEQARASLRQSLATLRKSLGAVADEVLTVSNASVRLVSDCLMADVRLFEELAVGHRHADQTAGVDLYKGDFLEGFPAISSEFDRWVASERSALRAVLMRSLSALLAHSETEKRPEQMIAFATRLLREDPLQEHVHRGLMRAYAAQGRYNEALRQMEDLTSVLEQNLGVRPEAATIELARAIQKLRHKGAADPSRSLPQQVPATEVAAQTPAVPKRPSIAVLPLRSLSSDEEASYFGEGVAEDIIIELSRSSELFVVARQSSFRFQADEVDPKTIGRSLGVRFCLYGSVRRFEKRVRVSAHLVTCEDGQELWADRYERELKDIFDIQTEIARTVTATVVGRIASADAGDERQRPESLQSYDLVLRGLQVMHRYTKDDIDQAQSYFAKAIELEPDYGRAHGLLALASIYANWYYGLESDQVRAAELAERAVLLDPRDTKAHCALGIISLLAGDHSRAGHHFETALALNANDDLILVEYGRYLMYVDRPEDGIRRIREAMRLNPYHPNWFWNIYGRCLHTLGRYEEAIETFEKVINPPFWTLAYLAACYLAIGDQARASHFRKLTYDARPDFNLETFARILPYQNAETAKRFIQTFKAAGLT